MFLKGSRPLPIAKGNKDMKSSSSKTTRRDFLATTAAGAAMSALAAGTLPTWAAEAKGGKRKRAKSKDAEAAPDPYRGLKMGVASYSFRQFPLDQALQMTRELGLHYIALKSAHLALDSTTEERKAAAQKVREAGLTLMGGGVISLKNNEANVRNAFEYARDAGMPLITISPDPEALPLIDKMIREFDIKAAIHNHGPQDKRFPSPLDAYRAVQDLDPRFGLCMDVGHTVRNGDNEVEDIHAIKDRLHDFHIKDVTERTKAGKTVEMGKGVVDLPGVMKALLEIHYEGHVAFEFEKDASNPLPGMQESLVYLRKVMESV